MHPSHASHRAQALLVLLASGCSIALVIVYLTAFGTSWGQRLDLAPLREGAGLSRFEFERGTRHVLDSVGVATVAITAAVLAGVALVRRGLRLALAVVAVIGLANIATQVLKYEVVPSTRELLLDASSSLPAFPSGHATVAMSLAVGLVLAVPDRRRGVAGVLGAGYAVAVGCSLVVLGWHRPSEVIGGFLVVGAVAGVVAAAVVGERARPKTSSFTPGAQLALGLVVAAGVGMAVVGALTAGIEAVRPATGLRIAALGAAFTAVGIAAALLLATLLAALRGSTLGGRSGDQQEDRRLPSLAGS